jgi:hypothetical protein
MKLWRRLWGLMFSITPASSKWGRSGVTSCVVGRLSVM